MIGGGVIGLAIAWRAARAGLHPVVFDPSPGCGASHASAGILGPMSEAQYGETQLLSLCLESHRRYAQFIAELIEDGGRNPGFVLSGAMHVARDADEMAVVDRELSFRRRLGLAVERLTAGECRSLEPALSPAIRGGMLSPGDGQVDPRRLVSGLLQACAHRRVPVVRARASVVIDAGRVSAVHAEATVIPCRTVVVAAGAWSADIDGIDRSLLPPVRPVKGQIVRLRSRDGMPLLRHVIEGYALSRDDGEFICGATVEEQGFDTTVTAGAVYEILNRTRELIPGVTELELTEVSAGLRPGTPDNAPCIGATSIDGLLAACGHYRNGVLLTPVTADVMTDLLTQQEPSVDLSPFSPLRFRTAVPAA